MIGAGSVVTTAIPDYAVVKGNPSLQNGWVSRSGLSLKFDAYNIAVCPHSGETYKLRNGIVELL